MEPERFDDVELHMIEEPAPRGPRRSTRWVLAIVAGVLSAATLAAGASALTSSAGQPSNPTAQQVLNRITSDASWTAVRPCPGLGQGTDPAPTNSVRN